MSNPHYDEAKRTRADKMRAIVGSADKLMQPDEKAQRMADAGAGAQHERAITELGSAPKELGVVPVRNAG